MHNGQLVTLGGIQATVTQAGIARGGQGAVHLAQAGHAHDLQLILKELDPLDGVMRRVEALVDHNAGSLSPFIAGPFSHGIGDGGEILHIAPHFDGVPLDEDQPRNLAELLAITHHAACQLCILHENGLAHGDIAPSNFLTDTDCTTCLIDLDCFVDSDPSVPDPLHIGQHLMMAPELRAGGCKPSIDSDLFAFATLASMELLGRHAATDLANTPAETDRIMSQGIWPERQRMLQAGETPIEALGPQLPALFDAGFSIDPSLRPSMEEWRQALHRAVNHCYQHNCGQLLVVLPGTTACPWCGEKVQVPEIKRGIKIILPIGGTKFGVDLPDRKSVVVGRNNLPVLSCSVSGRHLEILRTGDKILLHHIGRHPTLIRRHGQWYRLDQHWFDLKELHQAPIELDLAGEPIVIEAYPKPKVGL